MVATDALNTLVGWIRAIRNVLAGWFARDTRAAARKKEQRRETDQRLRRDDHREGLGADRQ
jgi:hypothetical protein